MAKINKEQIEKVAAFIKQLPDSGSGLNFYSFKNKDLLIIASDMYPPLNHPEAINFFFFVCLHQFGFWHGDESGYVKPLVGTIDGNSCKGSDLLWKVCKKAFDKDPLVFGHRHLAKIKPEELFKIFTDDEGLIPFPDLWERLRITRMYGKYFIRNRTSPLKVIKESNKKKEPLGYFLAQMWGLQGENGFNEDKFCKKMLLLAMVLANRPEKFLVVKDDYNWEPIIDYHLMRTALRLGLVDLNDDEYGKNRNRRWVSSRVEQNIRKAVDRAMRRIIKLSGRPMSFVDEKMWNSRRYCPEMDYPDCSKCIFLKVCKHRTELFQPVFRTTAY
ncbi:MAG: queuosine salvage family protein [Candidatus Paceibacterota bacterium]